MLVPLSGPLAAHPEWLPQRLPAALPSPAPHWVAPPIATPLHPVVFDYGSRFQELLASTMGGPHASTTFGPTVAEADVHWRLVDATGYGLPIDLARATAWRDASLGASLLAGTYLLDETLERAPMLYTLWTVGDAIVSPSLDVRGRADADPDAQRVTVRHTLGGRERRALERREEESGEIRAPRARTPSLSAGLDWDLRDEDAGPHAPLVRYTAWLAGTELGLSAFRLEIAPTSLSWLVTAREQVYPRVFLIGSARSLDHAPDPAQVSAGLMWVVPGDRWNVRAERIVAFDEPDARWMITLRCENRTAIPAPLEPPLGDRGRPGPVLPWARPGGGNVADPGAPTGTKSP